MNVKNAEIAQGILLGMMEDELVEKLKNAGVEYSCADNSYSISYAWGENDYSDYIQILVDAETKTVSAIEIRTP